MHQSADVWREFLRMCNFDQTGRSVVLKNSKGVAAIAESNWRCMYEARTKRLKGGLLRCSNGPGGFGDSKLTRSSAFRSTLLANGSPGHVREPASSGAVALVPRQQDNEFSRGSRTPGRSIRRDRHLGGEF